MYDPVIYHFRRAYPGAATVTALSSIPSPNLRCADARHCLADAAFELAYCFHDGKDMFITALEIHARRELSFSIECPHFDLHGCYVAEGQATFHEPPIDGSPGARLALHTGTYALIYAPRGTYTVAVPQGITVVYGWSTNGRLMLRTDSHRALKPLHSLFGQWKAKASRCHHTRVLPFAGVCTAEWDRLLKLPKLRPLTMDQRLLEHLATLVYSCIDALAESRKDRNRSLKLIQDVRKNILTTLHQGAILRIRELAERHAVSKKHLHRLHQKYYNSSLKAFITRIRLKHGHFLLSSAGLTIREAAYAAGYGSESEFKQAFKKYFGYLPKESLKKR